MPGDAQLAGDVAGLPKMSARERSFLARLVSRLTSSAMRPLVDLRISSSDNPCKRPSVLAPLEDRPPGFPPAAARSARTAPAEIPLMRKHDLSRSISKPELAEALGERRPEHRPAGHHVVVEAGRVDGGRPAVARAA